MFCQLYHNIFILLVMLNVPSRKTFSQTFVRPVSDVCIGVERRDIVQQLVVIHKQLDNAATLKEPPTTAQMNQIFEIIRRLDPLQHSDSNFNNRTEVCSESYRGPALGWVTDNCTDARPLSELIEMVLFFPTVEIKQLIEILKGIRQGLKSVKIHVAVSSKENDTSLYEMPEFYRVNITYTNDTNPGRVWNKLVSAVSTRYVFVGRNLDSFDVEFSSFERQIRVLGATRNVQVVGGAFRNQSGHWHVGCFQTKAQNYALRYKDGYHASRNECMFCDHLLGPFIARTSFIINVSFDESLPATVLFEDWFLQVRNKQMYVMNCPDVMYFASDPHAFTKVTDSRLWIPLVRKWGLNRLTWSSGTTHVFTCEESALSCDDVFHLTKYYLMPPCCLQKISSQLRAIDQVFTNNSATYELLFGSVLGAIKMSDFIPWDLDFDIIHTWRIDKHWANATEVFSHYGLKLGTKNEAGFTGFCRLFTSPSITVTGGFYFELWPPQYVDPDGFKMHSPNTMTKISVHGIWVYAPPNPGFYARNRYGREILKHTNSLRQGSVIEDVDVFISGHFNRCPKPIHHACLDHFPPDGNILFKAT